MQSPRTPKGKAKAPAFIHENSFIVGFCEDSNVSEEEKGGVQEGVWWIEREVEECEICKKDFVNM